MEGAITNLLILELAWAAGFFDGEGHARWNVTKEKRWTTARNYGTFCVTLDQVEREPLDRFHAAVGYGKVYGPYKQRANSRQRDFYKYVVTGREAVEVFQKLRPHLSSIKRAQGDRGVIQFWDNAAIPKRWRNGAMKKRDEANQEQLAPSLIAS